LEYMNLRVFPSKMPRNNVAYFSGTFAEAEAAARP